MLHADIESLDYPAIQALQRKRLAELARRHWPGASRGNRTGRLTSAKRG